MDVVGTTVLVGIWCEAKRDGSLFFEIVVLFGEVDGVVLGFGLFELWTM